MERGWESALSQSGATVAAQEFVRRTFECIERGKLHEIAAAFTFGREDVIPDMFRGFIRDQDERLSGRLQTMRMSVNLTTPSTVLYSVGSRACTQIHSRIKVWRFAMSVLSMCLVSSSVFSRNKFLRFLVRISILLLAMKLCGGVAQAQTATTTTLVVSPSSPLAPRTVLTLTATVMAGVIPVHPGLVTFCDASAPHCVGLAVLGTAQLTSAGTATIRLIPGSGSHSYQAIFAGIRTPAVYSTSTSAVQTVTVSQLSPLLTTTSIVSSGSAGNYTLTATTVGSGPGIPGPSGYTLPSLTGSVSFGDTTAGNTLGTTTLGASTLTQNFIPAPNSPVTVGNTPNGVATGDFNGDGVTDFVVTNGGDNTIKILLGNGDGTFTAGSTITVGLNPFAVAVGDFNGDGIADVVVTNAGRGATLGTTIDVLLGNGSGGFTEASGSPITVAAQPTGVAIGDFNGDGIADLVVANYNATTLSILLGNGNGTFTTAPGSPFAVRAHPQSVAVGDFNHDGIQDLAIVNANQNEVIISLGIGDGSFTTNPAWILIPVGIQPFGIAIGDFNNDGNEDLAVTNYGTAAAGGNTVSILLGDSHGNFTARPTVTVGSYPQSVVVSDFNGDGIADLAVTNGADNTVTILLGDNTGGFTQPAFSPLPVGSDPLLMAVGDFNQDGMTDLAIPNAGTIAAIPSNTVSILLNHITQTATAVLSPVSLPGSGTHLVDATYPGDTNYSSSTAPAIPLTATQVPTTLALAANPTTSTYGQQVVLTATLSPFTLEGVGTDGEAVRFLSAGFLLGTGTLSSGVATLNITSLPVGTNSLTAVYAGDANFLGSTSPPLSLTVTKATPGQNGVAAIMVRSSLNPSTFGQAVSFTATVPAGATGTVTFLDGTTTLGTGTVSSGTATFTTSTLVVGTHSITAVYSGDTNFNGASSAVLSQVVNKATPGQNGVAAITVRSSLNPSTFGQAVTFTATVPAGATGTVTFLDGTTPLCSGVPVSLVTATCTTSVLTVGTHSITAVYSGDTNFNGASSAVLSQVVNSAADFAVAATPATQIIPPGASASYSVSVSSVTAPFTNPVTLTATGLPPEATYSFSPATVTPGANGASSTLMISVPRQSASATPHLSSKTPLVLAVLLLPLTAFRRGRGRVKLLLLLVGLTAFASMTGCGAGGYFSQPQKTYTITVTGTSGTLTHSTTITLTVQ